MTKCAVLFLLIILLTSRSQLLFLVFFTTAAVGFITAQYLYIWVHKFDRGMTMGQVSMDVQLGDSGTG